MPKYRRGSGSIYKKRGVFYIAYYENGEQICESAKTTDKGEARRKLQAKLGQIAEGRSVGPEARRITFEDLKEGLIRDYTVNKRKTLAWAERRIRLHLAPHFDGKKPYQTTTADVEAFKDKRLAEGASNGEINRELSLLKRMYNLAPKVKRITDDLVIQKLDEHNARKGFFERAQFDTVLAKLPDYLKPPVTFAYQVGWRSLSEILPLTWPQVDLEIGTVRLEVGETKNRDGRLVYLPPVLMDVLEQQWQNHLTQYPECPWVFHNEGKRMFSFYKAWHRACREAGVSGKIPHDFRRTAVRNMVRAGIPERVAMEIAGHKTRAIFDRYHIVSEGDLKEAARKLEGAFLLQTTTLSTTLPLLTDPQATVSH